VAAAGTMRFTSVQLLRARRLADIERTFDANEELAALVVDLIEEVERLRRR
jgi:chaperone modulatory protein CbpM